MGEEGGGEVGATGGGGGAAAGVVAVVRGGGVEGAGSGATVPACTVVGMVAAAEHVGAVLSACLATRKPTHAVWAFIAEKQSGLARA